MSITSPENERHAAELASATKNGDLAKAYRVIQGIAFRDLQAVALTAGFSCVDPRRRRDFLTHLQGQIAKAAKQRTDGWGLRAENPNAV